MEGRVVGLFLANNQLFGPVPQAAVLNALSSLQVLDFQHNFLQGSIPALVMPALRQLSLGFNSFTGFSSPDFGAGLPLLEGFDARANLLSGELPRPLLGLNRLTYLNAGDNRLQGTLPALPPSARSIYLYNNAFVGTVPELPPSLIHLWLVRNFFSGTMPRLPGGLSEAAFSRNGLEGFLPPFPRQIVYFAVDDNNLSGPIPAWEHLEYFQYFFAYQNALSGALRPLPPSLRVLNVRFNQLRGPLPRIEGPNLFAVEVGSNNFDGPLIIDAPLLAGFYGDSNPFASPLVMRITAGCALQDLFCSNCSLNGPLPALERCEQLHTLALVDNALSGTISVSRLPPNLERLFIDHNRFEGSLPWSPQSKLRGANLNYNRFAGGLNFSTWPPSLTNVAIKFNSISGPLPAIDSPHLTGLFLDGNLFTSSLRFGPQARNLRFFTAANIGHIGRLSEIIRSIPSNGSLALLDLSDNNFAGQSIPMELCHTSIRRIVLQSCGLSGPIPRCLWAQPFSYPGEVRLSNNALTGSLPSNLSLADGLVDLSVDNNALSGPLPVELPSTLLYVIMDDNQWTPGPIPDSYGTLPALLQLYLRRCRRTGLLPTSILEAPAIVGIHLDDNSLSGPIPDILFNYSFSGVNLANNQLEGTLPPVHEGTWLVQLVLANNKLHGPLPVHADISFLDVRDNAFSGTVPQVLLESLVNLEASNNNLSHLSTGCGPHVRTIPLSLDFRRA